MFTQYSVHRKAILGTFIAIGLVIISAAPSAAQDDGELSPLTVVGSKDRAFDLVGSAAYLDSDDIEQQN